MDRCDSRRVRGRAPWASFVLASLLGSSNVIAQPATTLETLKLLPQENALLAVLEADGIIDYRVVDEQNPGQRLVLDVLGAKNPLRHYQAPESHRFLVRIAMYEYPEATNPKHSGPLARIVFELKHDVDFSIAPFGTELHVTFRDTTVPVFDEDSDASEPDTPEPAPTPEEEPELAPPVDGALAAIDEDADASDASGDDLSQIEPVDEDPTVPSRAEIEPDDVPLSLFFAPAARGGADYRLGAEDVIDIRVFELDQLNRTVRISGDGSIDLPLVGSLRVSGLTADDVGAEVAAKLKDRYVQNPQVSVFIKEFNSNTVSLLGAVQNPSTYPLGGQRRLLQLLAQAGSLAPDAGRTLYVFRQTDDGRTARLTVPLNDLLVLGDPRWNIAILPGDVVSVPPEEAIGVSVLGAVNNPGVYKLPVGDEATLLKAVALAGGLNDRASKKGVRVKRRDEEGEEVVLKINLGDILSGKKPDIVLIEGDVVVINESFFLETFFERLMRLEHESRCA